MERQELCVNIFKNVYEEYKQITKEKTGEQKLSEKCTPDYVIFKKINKYFNMLDNILKYVVLNDEEYYVRVSEQFKNLSDLTVNVPKFMDELFALYSTYPKAIDKLHEDLYELINVEHYEGMLLLRKLNPLLYYSTIDLATANIVFIFEDSANCMNLILGRMVNKLLRGYVQMSIEVEKNKVRVRNEDKRSKIKPNSSSVDSSAIPIQTHSEGSEFHQTQNAVE